MFVEKYMTSVAHSNALVNIKRAIRMRKNKLVAIFNFFIMQYVELLKQSAHQVSRSS